MNNPVWSAATISAIVSAFITLLVAFGVPVTEAQTTAILGFVAVVAPIGVAWYVSSRVTSLSNPKDETGEPLVRAADGMPTQAQTRSMAKK